MAGTKEFLDASKFWIENQLIEKPAGDLQKVLPTDEDTENGQFALEDELEGFIYANWNSIPFFSKLRKFELPQSHPGRQVPTDVGEIDFLARDPSTNGFVVVELKRNRSSDDALGQILRYMGWVADKLADHDRQRVRGLIVCLKQDERLKYAVAPLGGIVTVLEYQVKFQLTPAE